MHASHHACPSTMHAPATNAPDMHAPCHTCPLAMHDPPATHDPPVYRITDACENITVPQLLLRTVMIMTIPKQNFTILFCLHYSLQFDINLENNNVSVSTNMIQKVPDVCDWHLYLPPKSLCLLNTYYDNNGYNCTNDR